MLNKARRSSAGPGQAARPVRHARFPRFLLFVAACVAAFVLVPLAYLVVRAFEVEPAELRAIVLRERNVWLLGNTVLLTGSVLLATTLLALPLAWLTTRSDLRPRGLLVLIGVLPLAIPGYVGAYAMIAASGTGGLIDALTGFAWPRPSGYWGALGILTLFTFPYLFLNFWTSLRGLDPSLEEAARALGHGPLATFWRVTLPQLRPAALAGALLVVLHVLGDFGVVSLMRFETFSYAIYQQYNGSFDRTGAAWLSLMLLLLTGATLMFEARLLRHLRFARVGSGTARRVAPVHLGMWRWPALLFCALVAGAALLVPMASLLYWLGRGLASGALRGLWPALLNSLQVAAPAAVIAALLALPLAYLGVRFPSALTRLMERAAYVGYATPPLAYALALIFFTLRTVPPLYQTLTLLVLAYALHFLAEAIGPVRSALYQATERLEDAARMLGHTGFGAFRLVTLPLLRPGLLAATALVLLSALKELPLTFLLSPSGFNTLATDVWSYTSEAMFAEAAPYALMLVAVSTVASALILRQARGGRGGAS
ncbi:ABC transporter permease [Deinococcus peraridilitoris]|uniref:ABC-type Fe3+ transport system, permease component n=1 Tax=Deinococcus peraridilitoris (strain DSM 19664 / LMG 22246 / CIP 109416 / KR-200) TaxID=937777 RepID=K9ZXE0_DEIPD|nr:iron ABC transporter permease [Deinococcus peraridilitoris]AFZ66323.1 ABC-type Fe3+ transport system, permease component [Deinococcus peraridilitoris DSM 19664]